MHVIDNVTTSAACRAESYRQSQRVGRPRYHDARSPTAATAGNALCRPLVFVHRQPVLEPQLGKARPSNIVEVDDVPVCDPSGSRGRWFDPLEMRHQIKTTSCG